MKTTFSYFLEMFENPAAAKIIFFLNRKYYEILTILYSKYCLYYLNDLFGIKLICLRSELNVATFRICLNAAFFGVSRF